MRPVLCSVLVGRNDEQVQLRAALARARAGSGGTILLSGDAGIGKSRLAREAAEIARQQESAVLVGRAVASAVPTPFRPFAEALASALRTGGPVDSAALAPYLPALGRLVPHVQPDRLAPVEESLVFLGEAVFQLLRAIAPDSGALVVLDDLHWADKETLALLEYLADNALAERLLIVGTYRPDDGADIADLAAKLETRGAAEILALGRLDERAVADMAQTCLGGGLPRDAGAFLAQRSEGVPFLVEELLASMLGDGVLVERAGTWEVARPIAAGVPVTFASAVERRLDAAGPGVRRVIQAAAVLGRNFEWSLLAAILGSGDDDEVLAVLREGIELQLIDADGAGFRFRHALTQDAVLATMLPPERAALAGAALAAIEQAHPELPDHWCRLAAGLAEQADQPLRACELMLTAGERDLQVGALPSAEETLLHARSLAPADARGLEMRADEGLTEVYALTGRVDEAIEVGQRLLARFDPAEFAACAADLHLMIGRAAIAGGRWDQAEASLAIARRLEHPDMPRVDACRAQLAERRGRADEAARIAGAVLEAVADGQHPEAECEALEVLGRSVQHRDLEAAERAFARQAAVAAEHGLRLWHLRALLELGTTEYLCTDQVDGLLRARAQAVADGALAQATLLDLLVAAGFNKQFRAEEALEAARRCAEASRRYHLATLPLALHAQAVAHAIRGEEEEMEARLAEAIELAPGNPGIEGQALGYCRALICLLAEDLEQACSLMTAGAALVLPLPWPFAPVFLGVWPLLAAVLGHDGDGVIAQVKAAIGPWHRTVMALVGYAEAVMAGRRGETAAAGAAFAAADKAMSSLVVWYRQYARRLVAQAALADGWGDPVSWLRQAASYFEDPADDRIEAACRRLLREAGAPIPRRRAEDADLPERLRAAGITGREADVLTLVARGLTNREIAGELFLSPRTVEKHVASLLDKTGLRRRAQLAGYAVQAAG